MQGIVDCGQASFSYYNENMFVWSEIREVCAELLSTNAFGKFQELCDWDVFDTDGDDHCRSEWEGFIRSCNPEDEEIALNDFERQIDLRNDFEQRLIDARDQCIALDQLKAWSLYVEDKPVKKAAYRKFLVSIFFLCMQCDIIVTLSHIIYPIGAIQP